MSLRHLILMPVFLFYIFISSGSFAQTKVGNEIYQKIFDQAKDQYQQSIKDQASQANETESGVTFSGNGLGLTWHHNYGSFHLRLNRQLAPDLFDDKRWIVSDEVEVAINVKFFLDEYQKNHPENSGKLPPELKVNAFAGAYFRRIFTFMHFAPDFKSALVHNLDRILTPFQTLLFGDLLAMQNDEFVERSDYLGGNAAGVFYTPLYGPFSAEGVVAVNYTLIDKINVTKTKKIKDKKIEKMNREIASVPEEKGHYQISLEKNKVLGITASAAIEMSLLEFFKTNVFQVDFNYEKNQSLQVHLEIDQDQFEENSEVNEAIKRVIHGKLDTEDQIILAPFLYATENKESELEKLKWTFLLLQWSSEKQTQSVALIHKGQRDVYFNHRYKKIFNVMDWQTWLLNGIFGDIIDSLNGDQNIAQHSMYREENRVDMEYQSKKDYLSSKESYSLEGEEKSSLRLIKRYVLGQKIPLIDAQLRKKMEERIESFSNVPKNVLASIEQQNLVPPYIFSSFIEFRQQAIHNLNNRDYQLNLNLIYDVLKDKTWVEKIWHGHFGVVKKFDKYWLETTHAKATSEDRKLCQERANQEYSRWNPLTYFKRRALINSCVYSLTIRQKDEYNKYVSLWRLKDFLDSYFILVPHRKNLFAMFGEKAIFSHGAFVSKTNQKGVFATYFKEGQEINLGVIDSTLRAEGLRDSFNEGVISPLSTE